MYTQRAPRTPFNRSRTSTGGRAGGRTGGRMSRGEGRPPRGGRRLYRPVKIYNLEKEKIEYKNLSLLQKFLTERGKILSHRVTGVTTAQQRKLTKAIKLARFLGLLPVGAT